MLPAKPYKLVYLLLACLPVSACGLIRANQEPAEVRDQDISRSETGQACDCSQQNSVPMYASRQEIEEIQARLILLGYPVGGIDGVFGENTRTAIRAYQADHNLLTDGRPSPELLKHITESTVNGVSGN